MLTKIADGVLVHQSEILQNNAVVVQGQAGVLLVDPGIRGTEMACLANDLRELGQPVVAGFATHPDWDHVLWHAELGEAPRYGTARCAAFMRDLRSKADWKTRVAEGLPPEIAEEVPLDPFGLITGLPAGTTRIPWDGPHVRIIEHPAHSPGHAALLIEEGRVLAAGDMLSDVSYRCSTTSPAPMTQSRSTWSGCGRSRTWRTTSMSSSPVTDPSAQVIRYALESTRIGRTCMPCATAVLPTTHGSAHRPNLAGNG